MAYTERYVTSAAGGGGDGSSGSPWTLAEAFANATAGDRVNIQSDAGYSLGATTITNPGTAVSLCVYRGYNTSIGDLEGQGRNADGTLNTTNFPAITLTGSLTTQSWMTFMTLNFSGSVTGHLVGSTSADSTVYISCKFSNAQNHAIARCVQGDQVLSLIDCDLENTGATHGECVDTDDGAYFVGCRFEGVANAIYVKTNNGLVSSCLFKGNNTGTGVTFVANGTNQVRVVQNCTFYYLDTGVTIPNGVAGGLLVTVNNHATDCGKWLENLYSGTANNAVVEINNRTRDNTTPRTGIGDGVNIGEITTDTGDKDTDYVDADNDNFRLISAAPGKAAGLIAYQDCGAYQREEPAGGSSTPIVKPMVIGSG